MIRLKNIEVYRGDKLLFSNFNQSFFSPGLNMIEGKNGSGKTTLIKIIAGFITPNKGQIKNNFVNSYEWLQNHIYIGSHNSLSNELSVKENIKIWLGIRGWNFCDEEIEEHLKKIKILNFKNILISQCSDGIKRKTDLCKLFFSLQNKIKFWLLDEPTNNLDDEGKKIFEMLLKKFIENKGTVIMSSHESNISNLKTNYIKLY